MNLNRFQLENLSPPAELLNAVIQQITSHASVRSYRPDPLPPGALEVLVTAAQSASTSSNLQTYSIIAIEDAERRRLFAELTRNAHVADAPLFLVFCPDLHRLEVVCQRQGHPFADRYMDMFLQAVVDAALAAQNAAIAAESMGLGICMIGGIRNNVPKVAEVLRLPPRTFALVGMTVGYPATPPKIRHRLPLDVILHREVYSDDNLEEGLRHYDEVTAQSGIYAGRQVAVPSGATQATGASDAGAKGRAQGAPGEGGRQRQDPALYGWCEHSARRMARLNPDRAKLRQQLEMLGWEF